MTYSRSALRTPTSADDHYDDSRFEELLDANPETDRSVVREAIQMVDELRAAGIADHQYDLAPPYGSTLLTINTRKWCAGTRNDA